MTKTKFTLLVLTLLLSACASPEETTEPDVTLPSLGTPVMVNTPAPSSTPDVCAAENMADTLQPYLLLMQRFDDAANLVSNLIFNTPREVLVGPIEDLQEVRRDAQAETVPDCLADLQLVRITYMNQVIDVSLAFLNGNATDEQLNAGLEGSRQLRQLYDQELARLLGITPEAQPTQAETPAEGTPSPEAVSTAADFPQIIVTSPDGVNVRTGPSGNFPFTAILQQGSTATALGRSEDRQWILIESPDFEGQGWVFAALVELNISIDELFIAPTPTP
ncbi:MAG: SH3 domain-containing protein [Chloroflexi bacterium]|nr:MAG: SH3 domain-containing protein [Chloroflexota bacterium]MBL1193014.1 SH3 domain-containing protein [Chloroflexota bacterium]NOH10307.1 SH3 domain-containing protein [Chloroflexota bacterium]